MSRRTILEQAKEKEDRLHSELADLSQDTGEYRAKEAELEEATKELRNKGALFIQAAWRGHRVRDNRKLVGVNGGTEEIIISRVNLLKQEKAAREKAAIVIQKYARRELVRRAPLQKIIDANWKKRQLERAEADRLEEEAAAEAAATERKSGWDKKWDDKTSEAAGKEGKKVMRGVIAMQANARRFLAQRRSDRERAKAREAASEAERLEAEKSAADRAALLEKYPEGDQAATRIQTWWRNERARRKAGIPPKAPKKKVEVKNLFPENDPEIQRIIRDNKLLESRKRTRYIDRSQLELELTPTGGGNPPLSLVYDNVTKTFRPARRNERSYQGQWINGIFGNYQGGINSSYFGIREVEVEETDASGKKTKKKIRVDANGKELDPSQPLSRVGRDGEVIYGDQFMLGSLGRSRAHVNDMIELGPEGIPIAEFENSIALQAAVDEVRNKHRKANLPGGVNPMGYNEVRCAFARYKHNNYNERKEYIGTEDRYVLLIETRQGLTEVFVEPDVITKKIEEAEKRFMDDGTYKSMISAALKAHAGIADEQERIAMAERTVRQAIRNRAMEKVAQEVQEAQSQSRATQKLSDRDLTEIALSQGRIGEGADELKKKITRVMRNVPTPISNYVDHGGVAIQKSRRGANITFNGGKPNDVFWMNYPGTPYYARVACAPEDGLYEVFVNGQSRFVERKKGETWMDDNTIHYHDGANYVPLRVHSITFGIKPTNALENHPMARYQGGYKGYKGIQQMYDNFAIQVTSHIDEVRSVAIKVQGEQAISTVLKPIAFKDKDDHRIVFRKTLPTAAQIAAGVNPASLQPKDLFAKHPALTSLKGIEEVEEKTGISRLNPFSKRKTSVDDPKIEAALKRIHNTFGPVYSRVSMAGDDPNHVDPRYKDFSQWREIPSDQGAFYRDRRLYRFDAATNQYVELTQQQMVGVLMAPSKLNAKGEAIDGAPLSEEEANKYSGRFMMEISEMEVRDFAVKNDAKNLEEELRFNAMQGNVGEVNRILARFIEIRDAIEVQYAGATSEEKAAAYSSMGFDINARDPKSGKTALHLASEQGKGDVVEALLRAGADPLLKDKNNNTARSVWSRMATLEQPLPELLKEAVVQTYQKAFGEKAKTASQLARQAGRADENDPDNFVPKLEAAESAAKIARSKEEVEKLKQDAAILRARADKIKAGLLTLGGAVRDWVDYERHVHAERSYAGKGVMVEQIAEEKAVEAEAKKAKKIFDAKIQEYQEAEKKAAEAEKKAGIKPVKPKAKDLVPTPDKYVTIFKRIDLPVSGKYIEIPIHLPIKDDCVVQYYNNKGELTNKVLQVGEMIMDENAVRYYYGADAGFATSKMKYPIAGIVFRDEPTKAPEGWTHDEWMEAFREYREFEKAGRPVEDILPDEFKIARQEFQDKQAAEEAARKAAAKVVVDPNDPTKLQNMPPVATMPAMTALPVPKPAPVKPFKATGLSPAARKAVDPDDVDAPVAGEGPHAAAIRKATKSSRSSGGVSHDA